MVHELRATKNPGSNQILSSTFTQGKDQTASSNQSIFQAALQMIDTAVIATDEAGKILFLNLLAETLTGWNTQNAQSLPLSHIFNIAQGNTLKTTEQLRTEKDSSLQKIPYFSDHALLINSNKQLISIEYTISPIFENNQILGKILVFRAKSEPSIASIHPSCYMDRDALTGLVSRSSFENDLELILQEAKTLGQHYILCHLDLDRFKIINEICGHFAGDEFLRQFSSILQKRIRRTDILARLGGDEFALILKQCSLQQALSILQTLQEEVRKFRFLWQSHAFNFTFSAGVTLLHSDSGNGSDVLIEADSACSIAKGRGRDRIQVYQANDQDVAIHRGACKGVLRVIKALEEDQFVLYCQPIVPTFEHNLSDYQTYYEILIRLKDDEGKLIPPSAFLPSAEHYGLMHLIDRWVIQNLFKALSQSNIDPTQKRAQSSAVAQAKRCYSINLSGSSFNDDQFLDFVQQQFTLYTIPPESICFEITETVAIANLTKAAQFINKLRKLGCRFALDDFGSGMSSFGYLKSLPVDYIKIDGNFVREITENPLAYEIVKSINSIGHAMNIQTTAEFVENETILATLKHIGVDYVQGYGIAKPFPLPLQ